MHGQGVVEVAICQKLNRVFKGMLPDVLSALLLLYDSRLDSQVMLIAMILVQLPTCEQPSPMSLDVWVSPCQKRHIIIITMLVEHLVS